MCTRFSQVSSGSTPGTSEWGKTESHSATLERLRIHCGIKGNEALDRNLDPVGRLTSLMKETEWESYSNSWCTTVILHDRHTNTWETFFGWFQPIRIRTNLKVQQVRRSELESSLWTRLGLRTYFQPKKNNNVPLFCFLVHTRPWLVDNGDRWREVLLSSSGLPAHPPRLCSSLFSSHFLCPSVQVGLTPSGARLR